MTKLEYLKLLETDLQKRLSQYETDEIIRDYAEYFAEGASQGKTEEEMINNLGDPAVVAAQLIEETLSTREEVPAAPVPTPKKGRSPWVTVLLVLLGICLLPVALMAAVIALGLWKAEKWMVKGFGIFGKAIIALITVGLAAAILQELTGFVLIPGMVSLSDGFQTVGEIAIVLAGAFPLVWAVTRLLRKPLLRVGKWLGINEVAAGGLVATLANSIATFGMVENMDNRGKVVNIAFAVSAAFVFGDHLGFTAGFAPELLPAMILGKLAGGVSAIVVALWLTRKER